MARAGDKLGSHPTQSREKDGKGKQDLNHLITASASKAGKKMTRRQRQPRAKSGTETSLGTTAAAAAKSEIMKRQAWETRRQRRPRAKLRRETSLRNKTAVAAKREIMKGDKLERQGGSGSQKPNHEGRQAWETRRQRQPRAKSGRETSLGDRAAAAAKSEIMKGDKLGRQDGGGSQKKNHEGRQAWETRRQRQPRAKS